MMLRMTQFGDKDSFKSEKNSSQQQEPSWHSAVWKQVNWLIPEVAVGGAHQGTPCWQWV
jgi:hypothetical protein